MQLGRVGQFILFNAMASFGISMSISFFMTLYLQGFTADFFNAWMSSFFMGYLIAVPSSMVFVPLVTKVMNRIVKENI